MRWYAFEVYDSGSVELGAYLSASARDHAYDMVLDDVREVEDAHLGTVLADTHEAALDAIRAGDWEIRDL